MTRLIDSLRSLGGGQICSMLQSWPTEYPTEPILLLLTTNQLTAKKILAFDWMLTTATFIPWDNLWAIVTINRQLTRFFILCDY